MSVPQRTHVHGNPFRNLDVDLLRKEQHTVFVRRNPFLTLEYPIEIRHIVEPATIGDFCYCHVRIYQHTGDMGKTDVSKHVHKGLSCSLFDETAERHFRHIDNGCHLRKRKLLAEILIEIVENRLQSCGVEIC